MKTTHVRLQGYQSSLLLGMAILLFVVGINGVVSLRATRKLLDRTRAVEHTRTVSDELDATLATMLNLETGERGYLYTGQRSYLEPYELGKPELQAHLQNLARLIADNPVQQRNLERVRAATQDAMSFFQRAIELEDAGQPQAARQMVLTGGGKATMDRVRTALAEMRTEELRLLSVRSAEAQQSERYLLLTIPLSHVFTAVLLVLAALLVGRDLRKRVETARRLRELADGEREARDQAEAAQRRTESILSGISETFMLLDRNWNILYVNEQAVRLTGKPRPELIGAHVWTIFPELVGTKAEKAYRQAMETQSFEAIEIFDSARRKWFSLHLYPSAESLTVFGQDITGLKDAQNALIRSEKLVAVGRMASSVAHEINNPLEAVTNLVWIARQDPTVSDAVKKNLATADEELRRVAHITKQTLGFYRDGVLPVSVPMAEILRSVLGLYSSRIAGKQIALRTDYDDSVIFGYAGELRQLFSNLLANSIDAVPAHGKLAVKISRSGAWRGSERHGVRVSIGDNGCGIPAENLDSVFEPFFTTKQVTGIGLGLWVARQVVEKHGGQIRVRSSTGRHYTVISVFLPERGEFQPEEMAAAG